MKDSSWCRLGQDAMTMSEWLSTKCEDVDLGEDGNSKCSGVRTFGASNDRYDIPESDFWHGGVFGSLLSI